MTGCILIVKHKKYVGAVCAAILAALFIILNSINSDIFIVTYYGNSLFPEFIYGIALYYIYQYLKRKNRGYLLIKNDAINLLVFWIIGIGSFVFLVGDNIYNWHTVINRNICWGIPALFLVCAFLNLENQIKDNRFTRFCVTLGDASYVLYLFHTFIATFFTRILFVKIIANNSSLITSILLEIIIMSVTVLGSIIIYNVIDKPVQKQLRKVLRLAENLRAGA
jgi:peptidoglycan/LPS O-acetylase OafA/YrhL